jgi:hypothetical protein
MLLLMPARLAKCLVVALLVLATGGHWALLQTAAWVGMTIDYSQKDPFLVALRKTFDGKHPCQLCHLISKEKKSEEKKESKQPEIKLDFFPHVKDSGLNPPPFPRVCEYVLAVLSRSESPPAPPPRLIAT